MIQVAMRSMARVSKKVRRSLGWSMLCYTQVVVGVMEQLGKIHTLQKKEKLSAARRMKEGRGPFQERRTRTGALQRGVLESCSNC